MKKVFLAFLILSTISACKTKTQDPCSAEFDKKAMLENMADNIIMPRYQNLKQAVANLKQSSQNFTDNTNASNLSELKQKFHTAYLFWQAACIFEFGPAEDADLRNSLNSFPVFAQRLEDAVDNENYDFSLPFYAYIHGFPAIDYLLFHASDNDIIQEFSNSKRKTFLADVITEIETKINTVVSGWEQGYLNTFKNNTAIATNSPISLLVNQLSAHYETVKNNRMGDPLGAKVGYVASPNRVEAYYSGWSMEMAKAAITASQATFQGSTGLGLDDFLEAAQAQKDGRPLRDIINEQYTKALQGLTDLEPATLADAITNNNQGAKAAYAHILNQVVFLKTDLPSILCVSITYIDNTDDGD